MSYAFYGETFEEKREEVRNSDKSSYIKFWYVDGNGSEEWLQGYVLSTKSRLTNEKVFRVAFENDDEEIWDVPIESVCEVKHLPRPNRSSEVEGEYLNES